MTDLVRAPIAALVLSLLLSACASGGSGPNTPIATDAPPVGEPPPAGGAGDLVVPQPGQLDVRNIPAERIEAAVAGRSVTLRITFTSGIEPCYVLDSVDITRSDASIALTLREGHAPGDNACIDIAKQKHVIIELGELDPGTHTVSDATGGAPPIEVVVG